MEKNEVVSSILEHKIIAIMRGLDPIACLSTAKALYVGGIRLVEVTFDHHSQNGLMNTVEAISMIREHFGNDFFVGAGTVLTSEEVEMAARAGAQYILSPDTNPVVINRTLELELVSIPGALTPTEIMAAYNAGADFVKIFPASELGPDYIKAIRSPISHVRLLAVGGVHDGNAHDFLAAGVIGLGIGGNLVNKNWIALKQYEKITDEAKKLVRIVHPD